MDKYGADPVRWYLVSTSNPWLPTRFNLEGLAEVVRKYFDTLRNTYSFFALYANIDRISERAEEANMTVEAFLKSKAGEEDRFDRWIVSKYSSLVRDVVNSLNSYEITKPVRAIQTFVIDDLSNWYVRNNRRRFWAKEDDASKMRAYLTLYRILVGICRMTAPASPFIAELLWTELTGKKRQELGLPLSVHMTEYPKADESLIDKELEETMDQAERIVSLGRAARSRKNLKVRQPLSRLMVGLPKGGSLERLSGLLDVVKDELNVKEVVAADDIDRYVVYSAKLNFKTAGPKLGANVKQAAGYIAGLDSEAVKKFAQTRQLECEFDSTRVLLTDEEVEVTQTETDGFAVESESQMTVVLETTLTEALLDEGFSRELVNKIQNMRKTSGFEVTDHITVQIGSTERVKAAANKFEEFIKRETLAKNLKFTDIDLLQGGTDWNINGERTVILVQKV